MRRLASRILAVALLACAASSGAQERPLVLGLTLAQTGQLSDLAQSYRRGLDLWLDEANARGGVLGRRVELRVRDDKSDATTVAALYEKLLAEDKVDVLLGPAGSAATLPAMAVAETRRRMLVNGSGADTAVLKRGNRYAIHVPAATQDYGDHLWPLLSAAGAKRPLLLDRDDSGMAKRLREQAALDKVAYELADPNLSADPAALVQHARDKGVDAVIVAGDPGAATELVKAMKKAAWAPRVFVATAAAQPGFVRAIGQDAEYAIGVLPYSPAQRTGNNAAFVKAYRARHAKAPDFHAACGYAAGLLLEAGLREAGTTDSEKLREAFVRVKVESPFGRHEAGKDNAQAGVRPVLFQYQQGRRQVVWPEPAATARAVVPYPAWSERKLLTK